MAVKKQREVVGAYELVDFPTFQLTGVKAKIDTGADTGALHCTQIREVIRDGQSALYFSPFDHPDLEFVANTYSIRPVRSSNGSRQKRYFITTDITIEGKTYPITLSLADRTEMHWPVLVGRAFLKRYRFLVDVRKRTRV